MKCIVIENTTSEYPWKYSVFVGKKEDFARIFESSKYNEYYKWLNTDIAYGNNIGCIQFKDYFELREWYRSWHYCLELDGAILYQLTSDSDTLSTSTYEVLLHEELF